MAYGASYGDVGPMDAPWDIPDALTSVHQLQGLVGRGYCVETTTALVICNLWSNLH